MASSLKMCAARRTWIAVVLVAIAGAGCASSGTTCPTGQTACGSVCVDLQTDALHCGLCNTSCIAGASCSGGVCGCPVTEPDACGLKCVNKQTDAANCGACGHDCGLGTCQAAACACNPAPVALCPNVPATGTCVDTSTSAANCGSCGVVCIPGEVCSASTCACNSPKQICGTGTAEVCTNVQTDPRNCGNCGTACAAGQTCASGTCQQSCAAGLTLCSGVCVDLATNPVHCGTCATTCLLGQSCSAGRCAASCTTLTCSLTCCQAPAAGNSCCGTSCPFPHRNFIGSPDEQTYFDCTPSGTFDLPAARKAASVWAPTGTTVNENRPCPAIGGSTCLQVQRGSFTPDAACGLWCYQGPLAGTAQTNPGYGCPCPTQQLDNWY